MARSRVPSPIVVPEKRAPSLKFVPKLAWPSLTASYEATDLDRFPNQNEENWRFGLGEFGSVSPAFISAIRSARERVWLVDEYLFATGNSTGKTFFDTFDRAIFESAAQEFLLIGSPKSGHEQQVRAFKDLQAQRRFGRRHEPFKIEIALNHVRQRDPRAPHDRFAIIDDELWHWGANVGGTHHHVNAYSRGWSAADTEAISYFERLWHDLRETIL